MSNYWDESVEGSVIGNGNELLLTTEPPPQWRANSIAGGSSRLAAMFLIVNAALGAGLLNFPQAFNLAGGIYTALAVQAVMLIWIISALLVLAKCAEDVGASTLQDVLSALSGKGGLIGCSILVALYCFGTCITFLIIIGDQFDRVFLSLYGPNFCLDWYMNRKFTICISSIILILPFCYSKKIDFLKYISSVGVLAVLYVVFLIIFENFVGGFVPGPIKPGPDHWTDVFLAVPVICFGYQCHVSVIPIYSCMRDRSMSNFTVTAVMAIALCMLCYSLAGAFGYLTFGSFVTSDILMGYSGSDPFVLFGIGAIALKTYTTYPILLFCGREAVNTLWPCVPVTHLGTAGAERIERRRRAIIATVWFFASLMLAAVIPDIKIVIDVLGSLAAIFIFIFPGICLLQSTLHRDPHILLNIDKVFIAIATLFFALGAFIIGVVVSQIPEQISQDNPKLGLCI